MRSFPQLCPIMEQIRNIIFDFGNVLFDLDLPAIERGLRAGYGEHFDTALENLRRNKVFELYEVGGLGTEEFVDALRLAAPVSLAPETVTGVWNSIFIGMPRHRFDMLLQLRERYNVFLLSNINELHADWIDDYMVREHGIADFRERYFDGVYYSHLIRLRKPDRDIYEYVLADAELTASECVFFDDLEANIEAANAIGIKGILHPPGKEIAGVIDSLFSKIPS
jgi:putative hydrolase of the HAD superfamily